MTAAAASSGRRHANPAAAGFVVVVLAFASPLARAAAPDAFEQAFSAAGEPHAVHYLATYVDARGEHRLEVWRDGQTRLRRRTDTTLDVLVDHSRDDDFEMTVIDHTRRIATTVSRTSLYRAGRPTDWYALAHGLAKPTGAYSVTALAKAPAGQTPTAAACRWFDLAEAGRHHAVCWSTALRLPMRIVAGSGKVVWNITASDAVAAPASTYRVETAQYAHVAADDDMKAD